MTKKSTAHAIADLPTGELEKRYEKIIAHLDAIDALMDDAVELTDEDRRGALRLGGAGEVKALEGVLAFAEKRPEIFKVLGPEDDGQDPAVFETKLLKTRLHNADLLQKILARFAQTTDPIADSALYVATLAKKPALLAYEMAKPFQTRDREFGKYLNDAVNLYRGRAMAGVKTRTAKKEASARS